MKEKLEEGFEPDVGSRTKLPNPRRQKKYKELN
jgi:hypothetical protein